MFKRKKTADVRIVFLGGVGEVGKNMMVIESGKDMVLIDSGLMFPEEEMLGIDLVLPDFSYVVNNKERLKAIIITHGHEDHTGALPYLLKEVSAPVYGTKLTLGLIEKKLNEHNLDADTREILPSDELTIGSFKFKFFRVCHSIPDGVGIIIETPLGLIVHTGDYKIDQTPVDGRPMELQKLVSLGPKKVLALLSDSTNAETPGYTLPEKTVGANLLKIFEDAEQKIIIATFASHLHRIQQIVDVTVKVGRKLAVSGRSIVDNARIASELGYLKMPEDILIDVREIEKYPPSKVVVLCTGSQGEPLSALARISSNDHKQVKMQTKDTVVISASPIPGNERSVSRIINQIYKSGAEAYYEQISGVHVSGHSAQEELKLIINIVKPKYFIPIHGEYRHLRHHANLAEQTGIPADHIFICEDGDVLKFDESGAKKAGRVSSGDVFVDGLGVGDIGDVVLRDRRLLSKDGVFIVVVGISKQSAEIIAGPDVISRGFVYVKETKELIDEAIVKVEETLSKTALEGVTDKAVLKSIITKDLNKFLYNKTRRRPMVMPVIIEA
ncbi:ribonuclease J [Candidatus Oleimmundimicrobium sp.]|uniref:ribonuclease J n=1 Tax=Candidatus Oleimmundimicrobium sp. TaxID=3060597 RepID=UPI002715BCF9|nr:ribonuclease J [Candidatus Oleimmundimicrobium sp.]MDO8885438.1 ribonuclease J [Candidatus Oleimmundimicrobium sp.]